MVAIRLPSGRLRTVALLCGLAAALTGCASFQDIAGIQHPGYQSNGTYVLSNQEEELGCRALQERSQGLQRQMQQLSTRAVQQMQELPSTVAAAWGRLFGSPGDGVPALTQYNEAHAESVALDATLTRKGCTVETASVKR